MIQYNPEDPSYHRIYLDLNMKIYNELFAETDSRPKNPPQKRLSKKEFYKLLERDPSPLITNPFDERVTLNHTELIWFSQCKKPIPLKEVMKLRKKYFPNLYPKEPITRNLPAQGTTSYPGQFKFVDILKETIYIIQEKPQLRGFNLFNTYTAHTTAITANAEATNAPSE